MKVQEFINEVNNNKARLYNKTDSNALSKFIKETLNVKDYIPVIDKQRIAMKVLDGCTEEEYGVIKVDSFQKYFLFTINMLQSHTNLEFTIDGDIYGEYDELCKCGLLDQIIGTFQEDYERSNSVLNMLYGDMISNTNNFINIISRIVDDISKKSDGIIDVISDKIKNIDFNIDQSDIDKLKRFL